MRVTDRLIFDRAASETGKAQARAQAAVDRASSGARVVHPGDDPAASGLVVLNRARAARLDAIATTATRAADELNAADAALGQVANDVARARELATQFASAGYTDAQRADAANEVDRLLTSVVSSMNAQVGDRYVFGGTRDDAPPFGASGSYSGDAAVRTVEIAPGVRQPTSVRADVALKGSGGGVDVMGLLQGLSAALRANDQEAVQATLDPLATATTQVSSARAEAGSAMSVLDAAATASKTARDQAKAAVSSLADADVVESATELQLAERALEASLSAVTQRFKLTLLDKLS